MPNRIFLKKKPPRAIFKAQHVSRKCSCLAGHHRPYGTARLACAVPVHESCQSVSRLGSAARLSKIRPAALSTVGELTAGDGSAQSQSAVARRLLKAKDLRGFVPPCDRPARRSRGQGGSNSPSQAPPGVCSQTAMALLSLQSTVNGVISARSTSPFAAALAARADRATEDDSSCRQISGVQRRRAVTNRHFQLPKSGRRA